MITLGVVRPDFMAEAWQSVRANARYGPRQARRCSDVGGTKVLLGACLRTTFVQNGVAGSSEIEREAGRGGERLQSLPAAASVGDDHGGGVAMNLPLAVTTGAEIDLRVDWFSSTWRLTVGRVLFIASLALGCELDDWREEESGKYGYQFGLSGPGKAQLWWGGKIKGEARDDVHLSLPGEACGLIGGPRMHSLLKAAVANNAKATRLDLALDDLRMSPTVMEFWELVHRPGCVTHADAITLLVKESLKTGLVTGRTVYVGDKGSRQQGRVYDKNLESKGVIPSVRWELAMRDEAADLAMRQLAAAESWGPVAKARFVSFLDFREPGKGRRRADWYARLMDRVLKVPQYPPVEPKTLEEVEAAFEKQWGPGVLTMLQGHEGDLSWLFDMLARSEPRLRPKHLERVRDYLRRAERYRRAGPRPGDPAGPGPGPGSP